MSLDKNPVMISISNLTPELKVELLNRQAEFCKTFTNPTRLQILSVLIEEVFEAGCLTKKLKELNVTDILGAIKRDFNVELNQTTLSQHISILRQLNVLIARRDGNNIYYRVANKRIIDACCTVREIIIDFIKSTASLSESIPEGEN